MIWIYLIHHIIQILVHITKKTEKKEDEIFIVTENDDDTLSINNHKIKLNNNIYADINNNLVSKENPFLKAKNKIIEMSKNKDKNINKFQKDKINEI